MFGLSAVTKVAIAWFASSSAVAGLMYAFATSAASKYDFFLLQSIPHKEEAQPPHRLHQLATVSDGVIAQKNYNCLLSSTNNTPVVENSCVLLKISPKFKNLKGINNNSYKVSTSPVKMRSELIDNKFFVLKTGTNAFQKMSSTNHEISLIDNKTKTTKFKFGSFNVLMKINSKNLISNLILASSAAIPDTLTNVKDLATSKFMCLIDGYQAGKIPCNVFNVVLNATESSRLEINADQTKQISALTSVAANIIIAFQLKQYLWLQQLSKCVSISWYKVEGKGNHTLLATFKIKQLLLGNLINKPFSAFHYY